MFTMVRYFIKSAIGFLMAGLALGFVLLVRRELYDLWPTATLRSAHAHVLLIGFGIFLIMGVALWLFPKPARGDRRYSPRLIKIAYWALFTATALRLVSEVGRSWIAAPWLRWTVVMTGLVQAAAVGLYFWTMWSRIRSAGSHLREAKGEQF